MSALDGLNPDQRAAVTHDGGPLLVIAGAGSGKTRVLTQRIAHLIERGVHPFEILAITFTNKAADEMKDRVARIVGDRIVGVVRGADGRLRSKRWGGMWVATFHAACSRLLRAEAPRLGYDAGFTIYDAADATRLVGLCIDELGIDRKRVTARGAAAAISAAKNELVDFDSYALRAENWYEHQVAEVYKRYQGRLHRASAFDFDDLLVKTVELFQLFDAVVGHYRQRFAHVLVDEWQDTNRAQYELVKLLAWEHRNVCVVGDDAQSIYGFRGADIRNILDFERDFPDAKRVTLDRNYRSTQTILDAANGVIAHNERQMRKHLWTDAGAGEPVVRYTADNEHDEAAFVVEEIDRLADAQPPASGDGGDDRPGVAPGDCAVFYRTNAQSRVLEEVLLRVGLPYQIVGGTRFYERREVKDMVAYLRLLANPADDVAAKRVLNVPRRGIGAKTEQALDLFAGREGIGFLQACRRVDEVPQLGSRAVHAVGGFVALVDELRAAADAGDRGVPELVEFVWQRTGYLAELEAERTVEAMGRAENVQELASVAADFADLQPGGTLGEFLERVALMSETDDERESVGAGGAGGGRAAPAEGGRVTLMTMHNAKGLEFPVVFVVGMEDGVFPHHRSLGHPGDLEEERRLCYVAMTRAKARLYLTCAWRRTLFGGTHANPPSRFLKEVPPELVDDRSDDRGGPSRRTAGRLDEDGDEFTPGDRIRHPRFGPGRILELSGTPGSEEAVIAFDESGTKRLLLSYAPLVRA